MIRATSAALSKPGASAASSSACTSTPPGPKPRLERRSSIWGRSAWGLVACLILVGCEQQHLGSGGGGVGTGTSAKPLPVSEEKPSPPKKSEEPPREAEKKPATGEPDPAAPEPVRELTHVWDLSALTDIGPAGPATATARGIYMVTRADELLLAARQGSSFEPISAPPEAFEKYGPGPSVSPTHAYWISERSELIRASLKSGKKEVLFDKARFRTRTRVVTVAGRDVVTFVAQLGKEAIAYVFASKENGKHEIVRLSPEGAGASSVALVQGDPHPRAIVLSGRSGMSPVHVRRIRVTRKRITLEEDDVVWIAPGSHALTEIHGILESKDHAVAFLPTAKNFNDFGVAQLSIASTRGEIPDPGWQIFKNGLDPAPLDAARICGKPHLLFARPMDERPRSPQELHLVPIEGKIPGEGEVIARARAYANLSLTATTSGAIAAWTADRRTWALQLTCPNKTQAATK